MKAGPIIAISAGLYVLALMSTASKSTVKANSMRAQILDIDLDFQRMRLTINVQNPTSGNLVLRAIFGDMYVNGIKVANVSFSGYVNIPATGSNHFNIEGRYIAQNMGKLIYDLVSGRNRYELMFVGSVNINSELMPFTFQATMNG